MLQSQYRVSSAGMLFPAHKIHASRQTDGYTVETLAEASYWKIYCTRPLYFLLESFIAYFAPTDFPGFLLANLPIQPDRAETSDNQSRENVNTEPTII